MLPMQALGGFMAASEESFARTVPHVLLQLEWPELVQVGQAGSPRQLHIKALVFMTFH